MASLDALGGAGSYFNHLRDGIFQELGQTLQSEASEKAPSPSAPDQDAISSPQDVRFHFDLNRPGQRVNCEV